MNIDKWIRGYKVTAFPWPGDELIYFNVEYYRPGQSINRPPVWSKTVFVTNDDAGRRMVYSFTDSLTEAVARIQTPDGCKVVLTAENGGILL